MSFLSQFNANTHTQVHWNCFSFVCEKDFHSMDFHVLEARSIWTHFPVEKRSLLDDEDGDNEDDEDVC